MGIVSLVDNKKIQNLIKGEYYIANVFNNIFAQIYYVHELQHALRLCGLQELADNFIL